MKTAAQVYEETDIAQKLFRIKSKDSIRNYLEREILQASKRGEYEIKVNLNNLEGFVCIPANANFTFKEIFAEISEEMTTILKYTIPEQEQYSTNITISWEKPKEKPKEEGSGEGS